MIKQLIFDCDGVLVDTEIVAARVMVSVLAEHNVQITVDHYLKTYTGSTFSGIFRSLLDTSDEKIRELVEYCEKTVYEQLVPIEGIKGVVDAIELPKAVVSNSYLWQVNKALQVTQLDDHFPQRFSAQQVEKAKPAPDVYLLAAQTTGFRPEECLVVEDSKTGVTAAHSAGMNVIGFAAGSHIQPGHAEALKEKGAILTVDSPKALLLAIKDFIKS